MGVKVKRGKNVKKKATNKNVPKKNENKEAPGASSSSTSNGTGSNQCLTEDQNVVPTAPANPRRNRVNKLFLYDNQNKGPFGVWIKRIEQTREKLNPLEVQCVIKKHKGVLCITSTTRTKVEVMCKTHVDANRLLQDKELSEHNLEAFLPGYRRFRRGIIRGIPTELTEEDILSGLESDIPVESVKRLKKGNREAAGGQSDKWILTNALIITFKGQALPSHILIYKVITRVVPFVPKLIQCYSCFKFGHMGKTCKRNKICIMCGGNEHKDTPCPIPVPKCANCKEPHKSIDPNCKIFQENLKINAIMAKENLPFYEAKKKITSEGTAETSNENEENASANNDNHHHLCSHGISSDVIAELQSKQSKISSSSKSASVANSTCTKKTSGSSGAATASAASKLVSTNSAPLCLDSDEEYILDLNDSDENDLETNGTDQKIDIANRLKERLKQAQNNRLKLCKAKKGRKK